jgi:hypothetical protein
MASIAKGVPVMKRTKRMNIRRLVVGLTFAALAIPTVGQAKPTPGSGPILNQDQHVVIPYLSQGHGVTAAELGVGIGSSPDDRAVSRATSEPVVIPSLSRGYGVTSTDLGYSAKSGPDDRPFSRATSVGEVLYGGKVESGDDTSKYAASGFALVLLAMTGITLLVWRNRNGGKLTPA